MSTTIDWGSWPVGNMAALAFLKAGIVGLMTVPIPDPAERDVLIKVNILGICGTDVHLMSGASPNISAGLTEFPIRFGHEWSGTIVAVGSKVTSLLVGDRVVGEPFISCGHCQTCRGGRYNLCPNRVEVGVRGDAPGGAAEHLRMPESNVHVVPDGVTSEAALLAEPAVTVLNAFRSGGVQPGESVIVIGTGTMGLLAVQIAVSMNCEVDAVGSNVRGLERALMLGARAAYRPEEAPHSSYAVVIEASGSRTVGQMLTNVAGIGGRILQVGIPDGCVDGIDLSAMVMKGLSITGILGGVDLMPRALALIANGAIAPEALIEAVLPASRVNEAFERLALSMRDRPKIMLDMSDFDVDTVLEPAAGATS